MAAITAEIALELSKLRDSTNKAVAEVKRMKTNMKREGDGLGAAIFGGLKTAAATAAVAAGAAITAALVGTAAGLKNAFDLGGTLVDAAAQIGSTAGRVQVLRQAFENAGLGADSVAQTVNKMQKAMAGAAAGGKESGMFKSLGLDIAALMAMDPADAFSAVGAAIAKIDDPTKRAAASMEIFGRSGGRLLSLFRDGGGLSFAAEQLGKQSGLLDKSAADFDRASDIINGASRKIQGMFVGMGSEVVKALMPVLDEFNKLDLAGVGQKFGRAMTDAINYFRAAWESIDLTSGALLIGDALKIGFLEAVNALQKALGAVVYVAGVQMAELAKDVAFALNPFGKPDGRGDRGEENIRQAAEDALNTPALFDTAADRAALKSALQRIKDRASSITAQMKDADLTKAFKDKQGDGSGAGSKPKFEMAKPVGLFQGAINLLMGRSVNELALDEAKKTNDLLKVIAANTAKPAPRTASNTNTDLTARFA